MSIKPPTTELPIKTANSGFYSGFAKDVTITAKVLVGGLVIWAVAFPDSASSVLSGLNSVILASLNFWYVYVVAFFCLTCVGLALLPASGRVKLGRPEDEPEFSRFSWFSMMFGAGIGIGMLTYATGEQIYHFQTNPDIIQGAAEGSTADAVRLAYKWSFSHWGLSAWASYAIVGLSLAYFTFRRGLPLTIRSALTPLFGARRYGPLGAVIDVVAVVATVLGVAQTLGFGVNQFVAGLHRIGLGDWLLNESGDPTTAAILLALAIILGASTLSALSGVEGSVADQLAGWQGGWTIFYWAWWIAFAPFLGEFLARIFKGRTVCEYVLGAAIVPAILCFAWFALVGGTAIDLELSGKANNAIIGTGLSDQLFATLAVMLSDNLVWVFSVGVVVLLLTYLVTSADSAVLIINTTNAAGDEGPKARLHILFWGAALALVVGALLIIGGLGAFQTAMIIGALRFSVVMVLMGISAIKAIWRDGQREKQGLPTYDDAEGTAAE